MLIVPLIPVPAQRLSVTLAGQICQIKVRQNLTGVYLDLSVNNALVIGGVICQNLNRIVRDVYLGFQGDLSFYDTQGSDDPDYTGFGSRFLLMYLTTADLAALGVTG